MQHARSPRFIRGCFFRDSSGVRLFRFSRVGGFSGFRNLLRGEVRHFQPFILQQEPFPVRIVIIHGDGIDPRRQGGRREARQAGKQQDFSADG